MTARHLRIMTYHRVTRPDRFQLQMEHLAREYHVIDASTAMPALTGGEALPPRSVWVTFDDGHPTVIAVAQPILDALGIRATLFVCPGMVGTRTPFWWDVVLKAIELGIPLDVSGRQWNDRGVLSHLKLLDDHTRRRVVIQASEMIAEHTGGPLEGDQLTEDELQAWVAAGHGVGNHTWDHPILDRCDPDAQREQVLAADEWLATRYPDSNRIFAYPNGNWAAEAESALTARGYEVGLLFNQRLTRLGGPPLRTSRLRASADAELATFRAKISGAWGFANAVRGA